MAEAKVDDLRDDGFVDGAGHGAGDGDDGGDGGVDLVLGPGLAREDVAVAVFVDLDVGEHPQGGGVVVVVEPAGPGRGLVVLHGPDKVAGGAGADGGG